MLGFSPCSFSLAFSPSGHGQTIDTIAGGYVGDGGPATEERFRAPHGVARDAAGNLFVVEHTGYVVRRVDGATGSIATLAGNGAGACLGDPMPALAAGFTYPMGLALDGVESALYLTTGDGRIRKIDLVTRTVSTVAEGGWGGDGIPA